MTERTIEELRLDAIRIGMAFDGTLSERLLAARNLVVLMEEGPPLGSTIPMRAAMAAAAEPAMRPFGPVDVPPTAAPRGPMPETVADAITAARDDVILPPDPPPAPPPPPPPSAPRATFNGVPLDDPTTVRWTDERKHLATLEIEATSDAPIRWSVIAARLAQLPGMLPFTGTHLQVWWQNAGRKQAADRRREAQA